MSSIGWLDDLRSPQGRAAALVARAPQAVALLAGLLLAVQAGWLLTLRNAGPVAPLEPRATLGAAPAGAQAVRIEAVTQAHLFGDAGAGAASGDAPPSSAQLVLAGVLAVPDPRLGMAILGPTLQNTRLYSAGAAIAPGLVLHSVFPDRVLLQRNGVLETLALPKKQAPMAPAATVAPALQSPGQRLAALAQNSDGALLGGLVRAQPVFAGGKLSGYRIFPGGRGTLASFNQLGLRSGDMITSVNGTPLDDPSHANEILATLSGSASATLSVMRDGRSQDINVNLDTVAADAEKAVAEGQAAQQRGGAFSAPMGAGRLPGLSLNPGRPQAVEPADEPAVAPAATPPDGN